MTCKRPPLGPPGASPPSCQSFLPTLQIRDIGSGNFGVAKLCRAKDTGELVAVKFIERGEKVGGALEEGLGAVDRRGVRDGGPGGPQEVGGSTGHPPAAAAAAARQGCWYHHMSALPVHAHAAAVLMQIDKNVEREIINHRMLSGHPNIVRFREVRAGAGGRARLRRTRCSLLLCGAHCPAAFPLRFLRSCTRTQAQQQTTLVAALAGPPIPLAVPPHAGL